MAWLPFRRDPHQSSERVDRLEEEARSLQLRLAMLERLGPPAQELEVSEAATTPKLTDTIVAHLVTAAESKLSTTPFFRSARMTLYGAMIAGIGIWFLGIGYAGMQFRSVSQTTDATLEKIRVLDAQLDNKELAFHREVAVHADALDRVSKDSRDRMAATEKTVQERADAAVLAIEGSGDDSGSAADGSGIVGQVRTEAAEAIRRIQKIASDADSLLGTKEELEKDPAKAESTILGRVDAKARAAVKDIEAERDLALTQIRALEETGGQLTYQAIRAFGNRTFFWFLALAASGLLLSLFPTVFSLYLWSKIK